MPEQDEDQLRSDMWDDVQDWLKQGHPVEELVARVLSQGEWAPTYAAMVLYAYGYDRVRAAGWVRASRFLTALIAETARREG